jgi:hypothetical protein
MRAQQGFSNTNRSRAGWMTAALALVLFSLSSLAFAAQEYSFSNGITARIHGPEEINDQRSGLAINLLDSDRQFFPFDEQQVVDALATMHGFQAEVLVEVYLLPAPPAHVESSYATGNTIYLSPGSGPIAASTQAYITTHEMGHVLTWAFLDGAPSRWSAYMDLRGLDPMHNGPGARHADRAREILAEDFRFLFGGELATESGTIENHNLFLPNLVQGLEEMLVEFMASRAPLEAARVLACTAFPNPCNPRTTVSLRISGGVLVDASSAVLRVFDLRGALVKTVNGGLQQGDRVLVEWNGENESGMTVASGRYLYVLQVDQLSARGSVTLVR